MTITSEVTLPTGDGPMTAYRARPDGQARGAVIVVQEAFGVNPHIQDVTRRFAAAGWDAIAPAFFHRQGSPVLDYDDLATVMPLLGQMTPAGLAMDLNAAVDWLSADCHALRTIAVVGFCMGGTVTFYAATLRPLGAAVTFYGGGVAQGRFGLPSLIDLTPELQTPWLGQSRLPRTRHGRGCSASSPSAITYGTSALKAPGPRWHTVKVYSVASPDTGVQVWLSDRQLRQAG